eukprot:scaffold102321_cov78-Phaeocystis_antarctica.AAC.1
MTPGATPVVVAGLVGASPPAGPDSAAADLPEGARNTAAPAPVAQISASKRRSRLFSVSGGICGDAIPQR